MNSQCQPDYYLVLDDSVAGESEDIRNIKRQGGEVVTIQQIVNYYLRIRYPQVVKQVEVVKTVKKRVKK